MNPLIILSSFEMEPGTETAAATTRTKFAYGFRFLPQSCPACCSFPTPCCFFLGSASNPELFQRLFYINRLKSTSAACSPRTLGVTVGISFCPRGGVRVETSQLQGINIVSITPFSPKGWGSKSRVEKGKGQGSRKCRPECVNTGVSAEGLPAGGCSQSWLLSLGLCSKPSWGYIAVVKWAGVATLEFEINLFNKHLLNGLCVGALSLPLPLFWTHSSLHRIYGKACAGMLMAYIGARVHPCLSCTRQCNRLLLSDQTLSFATVSLVPSTELSTWWHSIKLCCRAVERFLAC